MSRRRMVGAILVIGLSWAASRARPDGDAGQPAENSPPYWMSRLRAWCVAETWEDEFAQGDALHIASDRLGKLGRAAIPQVIAGLRDENECVRQWTARAALRMGEDALEAAPALQALLVPDESPAVRKEAVHALLGMGQVDDAVVDQLIEFLQDEDRDMRRFALHLLRQAGPAAARAVPSLLTVAAEQGLWVEVNEVIRKMGTAAIPFLRMGLGHESARAREIAAYSLGHLGPAAAPAVPELTAALQDQRERVRFHAGYALTQIGPAAVGATALLVKVIAEGPGDETSSIHFAMPKLGKKMTPGLIAALKSDDPRVRVEALFLLELLGPDARAALPALAIAIKDPDEKVRDAALRPLIKMGDASVPLLRELAGDADPSARSAAVWALGGMGPGACWAAAPELILALKDPNPWIASNAGYALETVLGEARDPGPFGVSRFPNQRLEVIAARSIHNLRTEGKAAVPFLMRFLRVKDFREAAVGTLAIVEPETWTVQPCLADLLGHEEPYMRASAALALADLSTYARDSFPELVRCLSDSDEEVREAAALALGRIGWLESPELEELFSQMDDPARRALVVRVFAALGSDTGAFLRDQIRSRDSQRRAKATEVLQPMLADRDLPHRIFAARLLAEGGSVPCETIVDTLAGCLDPHATPGTVLDAIKVLGDLGPEALPAVPALIEAVGHSNDAVRMTARRVLRSMCEHGPAPRKKGTRPDDIPPGCQDALRALAWYPCPPTESRDGEPPGKP